MSDERRVTREGIHIDSEIAEAVAIEEELDSNVVGPYRFPNPRRRRVSAWIYAGLTLAVAWVANPVVAVVPLIICLWHVASAWPLQIEQEEAVTRAGSAVPFPVGHASAAVSFHGFRARPRWSVILYSAAAPPDQRALVVIDAVSGEQLEDPYIESI